MKKQVLATHVGDFLPWPAFPGIPKITLPFPSHIWCAPKMWLGVPWTRPMYPRFEYNCDPAGQGFLPTFFAVRIANVVNIKTTMIISMKTINMRQTSWLLHESYTRDIFWIIIDYQHADGIEMYWSINILDMWDVWSTWNWHWPKLWNITCQSHGIWIWSFHSFSTKTLKISYMFNIIYPHIFHVHGIWRSIFNIPHYIPSSKCTYQ